MFSKKYFKVAIIGLGYVGLPLYMLLNKKKIDVIGFDKSLNKIKSLKKNKSYVTDVKNYSLKKIKYKKIYSSKDYYKIKDRNLIIICLPTPLTKHNVPDLTFIKDSFKKFKKFISSDCTIILESTVYPGATRNIFEKYIKKKFNINDKVDFAYSSERISPGQTDKKNYKLRLTDITKVISVNKSIYEKKIKTFYKFLFKKVYLADSIETAEMSKLLENSYRAVNIGLVNEFKIICKKMNLNINKVIDTASTKPFGFTSFRPGPGVGGHCIPIDPIFVKWISRKFNYRAKFIELAHTKNIEVTNWVLKNIIKIFKEKNFFKKKILVMGVAYKENINDYRESPAIKIIEKLKLKKFRVDFYDPFIKKIKIKNTFQNSLNNLKKIKNYDLCLITTGHEKVDYKYILKHSKKIADTRGIYKDIDSDKVIHL